MKDTKDLPQNVRVNSQRIERLKEKGWSTQRIVDWAMDQIEKRKIQPKAKK